MSAWSQRLENPVSERLRDPASTGYLALGLGVFAAFLAIPPIEARTGATVYVGGATATWVA